MLRSLRDSAFHSGLEAAWLVQVQLRFSFAGYDSAKPNVIVKLEQGEEPWVAEGDLPCRSHPGELVEWSPQTLGSDWRCLWASDALGHAAKDPDSTISRARVHRLLCWLYI